MDAPVDAWPASRLSTIETPVMISSYRPSLRPALFMINGGNEPRMNTDPHGWGRTERKVDRAGRRLYDRPESIGVPGP